MKGSVYMSTSNDRIFAALIFGISYFTAFIGPIVIWLLKREESPLVDHYGKEYINYLISYAIYGFAGFILIFLAIGLVILPILGVASVIFTIIAIVKALDGEYYRIPFVIRFF